MILALQGLPGSGKSTFRQQWVAEQPTTRLAICYDDLRLLLGAKGSGWDKELEDKVKKAATEAAETALKAGYDVCIDNTNLNDARLERWRQMALAFKTPFEVKRIDTPVHVCIQQDKNRAARVGRAVIEGMALRNNFIDFNDTSLYNGDFVLVDVDGTIANLEHRHRFLDVKCLKCGTVNPPRTKKGLCDIGSCHGEVTKKDWNRFFAEAIYDEPIAPIVSLVRLLEDAYTIIVVSGRPDDKCGQITEQWLDMHGVPYEHLFMRRGGDFRDDDLVKEEILSFLPKNRIAFILDDRDRVVKMWRKNGLRCLQVAEGDF